MIYKSKSPTRRRRRRGQKQFCCLRVYRIGIMYIRLSHLPALPAAFRPPATLHVVFILCGFCDKLKLLPRPPPRYRHTLFGGALVPVQWHFFIFYGSYDFSISSATFSCRVFSCQPLGWQYKFTLIAKVCFAIFLTLYAIYTYSEVFIVIPRCLSFQANANSR